MPTDATTRTDPLLRHRGKFPILAKANYLISNSLGAMPEAAQKSLEKFTELWANRGVRAWEEAWWTLAIDLGDLVAPLVGASPKSIAFEPSVTFAHALILSALDYVGPRRRIVTDLMHFPSILYLLEEETRRGAEVVRVPSSDGITIDTERLVEAIDERTRLVAISHVLFRSSYIHDIEMITRRCREVSALSVVDGYQAVGSIPVDVNELGVDIYIGGCLKWLCGGPGAAFVWVRPELMGRLAPRLTGWMAHRRPFEFEPDLDRRSDITRFLVGTPAIPALYAARPGLELIGEIGASAIREKSLHQTGRLLDRAFERGWTCRTPVRPNERGGTIAIDLPHGAAVSRALKAREILCDYRPGAGVRLSPHFYTRDEELDAAIDAMEEILSTNAWRDHVDARSDVT